MTESKYGFTNMLETVSIKYVLIYGCDEDIVRDIFKQCFQCIVRATCVQYRDYKSLGKYSEMGYTMAVRACYMVIEDLIVFSKKGPFVNYKIEDGFLSIYCGDQNIL